jgi:alkaline phosphatase D
MTDGPLVGGLSAGSSATGSDTAKIWVRVRGAQTVAVDYSSDECLSSYTTTATQVPSSSTDSTLIFTLPDLDASTTYYFRMVINSCRPSPPDCPPSPYRSFTTFPTNGTATGQFAFAFTADNINVVDNTTVPTPAYLRISNLLQNADASDDPKIFFQIGDWDHRNPGAPSDSAPPLKPETSCTPESQCTKQNWWNMYRDVRGTSHLADSTGWYFKAFIQPVLPVEHIWDNHDMATLDYVTQRDQLADRGFLGRPKSLHALQNYFPMVALPAAPSCTDENNNGSCSTTGGLWHQFTYANVDFFVLDLRMQRDNTPGNDQSILGGGVKGDLTGAQATWLTTALTASQQQTNPRWKIIISSLAFNPGAKSGAGGWGNFSTQRGALVTWIKNTHITNVVFVSGDLHSGGAIDDSTNSSFPEISVPHTNIKQPSDLTTLPYENFDTGCNDACTCQSGTWSVGYRSGRPGTGRCGYSAGGPGYVLLKVDNTAAPKTLTLEVRDATTDTVQLTKTFPLNTNR